MTTRTDFYVGRDPKTMEWLGSIAMDGYPEGCPAILLTLTDEDEYHSKVQKILSDLDHATWPSQGWPWPWKDSHGSSFAYAFDNGVVWFTEFVRDYNFGKRWITYETYQDETLWTDDEYEERELIDLSNCEEAYFPDMSENANVTLGERSGLIILIGDD